MTERKPSNVDFESWVDRKIREATERGEFDNLPGTGKPLPGAGNPFHDENWWLKEYLRREGVGAEGVLPPSLVLRRDVERLPDTVRELPSEQQVREMVSELNRRIVEWLRMPHGPAVPVVPVNADEIVEQWRGQHRVPARRPTAESLPAPVCTPRNRPWWRRILRREPDV
ncbi:DUF1992 domain-containing protein [Nocardia donostiensis]|uniref:Molecular chaperone DnaJ n=1 Tax=Nocardia donostiensis TaxID=1538463 RepID=A0A1V2TH48_9NOCA|nr:DUF1992 domain-containing protein [Nocardia donostiensis]ONM48804.1 molecular chaperone DnaJ [Nocardia donostiensis]OQS12996.1 molecular chaperone DnaJ [Nocardia donostiensis]OQS22941.1 molecular chaperone DnaJ [Nocardia donostiensis]